MLQEILESAKTTGIEREISDLRSFGYDIPYDQVRVMSIEQINEQIERFTNELVKLKETYVSYAAHPAFNPIMISRRLFTDELNHRMKALNEKIIDGCYYRDVHVKNGIITGDIAIVEGSNGNIDWVPFRSSVFGEKVRVTLFEDDGESFKEIYVKLSDGVSDPFDHFDIKHITESSKSARKKIESYCDSLFESWPWEYAAPVNVVNLIESNRKDKMASINELISQTRKYLVESVEDEATRFDVVENLKAMMDNVESMVSDLSKISTKVIDMSTGLGDDIDLDVRERLDEPMQGMVDAVGKLKNDINDMIETVVSGEKAENESEEEHPDGMDVVDISQIDDEEADDTEDNDFEETEEDDMDYDDYIVAERPTKDEG